MAVYHVLKNTLFLQHLSGALKNVCSEGFRETIFSSITAEVLIGSYNLKVLKEQSIERTPPEGCFSNFSAG